MAKLCSASAPRRKLEVRRPRSISSCFSKLCKCFGSIAFEFRSIKEFLLCSFSCLCNAFIDSLMVFSFDVYEVQIFWSFKPKN